jgi:hypothetical protein
VYKKLLTKREKKAQKNSKQAGLKTKQKQPENSNIWPT